MIKTEVKTKSGTRREIEVEVPADEVNLEMEKTLGEFASRAKIAGFRTGKAPRDLVKRMFLAEIRQSVVDKLAPKALGEAFEQQDLHPVDVPVISDFFLEEGQPFRFKAGFEVVPDFRLPDYTNLRIKKNRVSVEDPEIEKALEDLRASSAEYVPVEGRGVKDGDYVTIEIQGKDLRTKKLLPAEKVVVLVGHPENEPKLNETLLNAGLGEEKSFRIFYEKDHRNKRLAGRDVEYRMKVAAIKEKSLPVLDDDFAKSLGDFDSLDKVKAKIREELLQTKEKMARNQAADELVGQLTDQIELEIPARLYQDEFRSQVERMLRAHPEGGRNPDVLKAEAAKKAEKTLKSRLLLQKVADLERLRVEEGDLEEELKSYARMDNLPLAKIREAFQDEAKKEELRQNLLLRKAVDFLLGRAIIK